MFEYISYAYATFTWSIWCISKIEGLTIRSFTDPGTFISGAAAGGIARAAILPIHNGGPKGVQQTLWRRMPQFGFLMMFYAPVAKEILPGLEHKPPTKMMSTFLVASVAAYNMRLVCNPISRVENEVLRTGKSRQEVMRLLARKTILQFWYTGPNLTANALYFGVLFTTFEGLRRFSERNWFPIKRNEVEEVEALTADGERQVMAPSAKLNGPQVVDRNFNLHNYFTTAATNTVIGGSATLVASTLCYPWSAHQYLQTVIHDSALCRGLGSTLIKEVPMMAVFFGTFSLLQPILASRHGVRCGFGY